MFVLILNDFICLIFFFVGFIWSKFLLVKLKGYLEFMVIIYIFNRLFGFKFLFLNILGRVFSSYEGSIEWGMGKGEGGIGKESFGF